MAIGVPILEASSLVETIIQPTLTPEQSQSFDKLDGLLSDLKSPESEEFLTPECLKRYLRATKWNVDQAYSRINNTIKWRKEYKPDSIHPSEVEHEAKTGKQFFSGFDKCHRPILYLVPGRENTKNVDSQLRFVVFNLEKAIKLMPEGVESLVIILDYEGMGVMNAPSPNTGRKFLSLLSDHYPERLGMAFIVNPTWYIWTFFTIISPFMDVVTKAKVHMIGAVKKPETGIKSCSDLTMHIPEDHLLKEYGGKHDFKWDFDVYWEHISRVGE